MSRLFTKRKIAVVLSTLTLGLTTTVMLTGCGKSESSAAAAPAGVDHKMVADMLHSVMAADRKIYVKNVVSRLTKDQQLKVMDEDGKTVKPFKGSEDWETTYGTLPLPAQQFRYGSEEAYRNNQDFEYGLISSWAINKKHLPGTEFEKAKIKIMEETGKPVYGEETMGKDKFFVAMYPDRATAKACWDCHNKHIDSPKTDFKPDDVMGGIVIRIPM
jgi:hypothetical protein